MNEYFPLHQIVKAQKYLPDPTASYALGQYFWRHTVDLGEGIIIPFLLQTFATDNGPVFLWVLDGNVIC